MLLEGDGAGIIGTAQTGEGLQGLVNVPGGLDVLVCGSSFLEASMVRHAFCTVTLHPGYA